MAEARTIVDVGDADFEREVVQRSRALPVVVDFWAPWCGPCRTLGPVLERLTIEHAGAFVLAKVNVDQAPGVAGRFRIQSIPAVKAFRDGAVVAEFVGAQPEAMVRRFLGSVFPDEAEALARRGEECAGAGDVAAAEAAFKDALDRNSRQPRALLGLARVYVAGGKPTEALQLVERVAPGTPAARDAERLAAEIRVGVNGAGDEAMLRQRVAANLEDLDARYQLGRALAARGKYADALAELLEVVRRDPKHADGAARKAMLDVFAVLGAGDPVTQQYRSALAQALFR